MSKTLFNSRRKTVVVFFFFFPSKNKNAHFLSVKTNLLQCMVQLVQEDSWNSVKWYYSLLRNIFIWVKAVFDLAVVGDCLNKIVYCVCGLVYWPAQIQHLKASVCFKVQAQVKTAQFLVASGNVCPRTVGLLISFNKI